MSGFGQNNRTLNVDTLFVRDIVFKDFGNYPIPANQPLVSRGDGGTYFTSTLTSSFALPAVNAIIAPTADGGTYQFAPSGGYNVFNLTPGSGMQFYSNADNGGLVIYNIGPDQIIADGQVLPFSTLVDQTVGGRTLQFIGTGETYLHVSDNTIFFNTVFNSSYSSIVYLQSTSLGLEDNFSTVNSQLLSSIALIDELLYSTGLYNYNLISSYFLTPGVINISTVSTSLLTLGDNTIRDNALKNSIYDPCIVYTGSTLISTNTDFLTFTDNFTNVTFAIDKEYLYGSSTLKYGPSTTTVTRGQQVQLGWFPTLSTQTNTQSLRAQFVPVIQQIQVLEQLVSTSGFSTTTNYYIKNIGRFDEICNPTRISLIAPVIGATLRKDNSINNSWVQYDTATSSFVWGNNGGTGTLQPGSNYGDYAFWNGITWINGFSTISIGDQAGGNKHQGEAAVAVGAAAGYSTQGAYAVAVGYTAGQYAQSNNAVAIGNAAGNSNQGENAVSIGYNAGYNQGNESVAIGDGAGSYQSSYGIAIGYYAGYTQAPNTIAIGSEAGYEFQNSNSIAIGNFAAGSSQDSESIAIGDNAGVYQSSFAVAIGYYAGNTYQNQGAVAIGSNAGKLNQASNAIAIGTQAGASNQDTCSIAIGPYAGTFQSSFGISIGYGAGYYQGYNAIAIGNQAGNGEAGLNVQSMNSVAIGSFAAGDSQDIESVAIGDSAGAYQSSFAVAIGYYAGNSNQGNSAIAIGSNAGSNNQGQFAIAIGAGAGANNQSTCTIVLNATGAALNTVQASSFYVAPIRQDSVVSTAFLQYNTVTNEVVWNNGGGNVIGSTMTQSLIPNVDNVYDIGTSTLRLRHLYVGPSSLTIGTGSISADNLGNLFATNASGTTVAIGGGTFATNNFMVAAGTGTNYLAYSYDGVKWTGLGIGPFNASGSGNCVAWNGSLWLAGGSDNTMNYATIAYSSDGINWALANSPISTDCIAIAWNGSMWVAGGDGDNTLAYSYDGINWNPLGHSYLTDVCVGIAWNGSMWVAVGSGGGGSIFYSYDGINWLPGIQSATFTPIFVSASCVAWNGTLWVIGGSANWGTNTYILAYSYDGVNWLVNDSVTVFPDGCNCVAWNGSLWVAGGNDSFGNARTLAWSLDGINWTRSSSAIFPNDCYSVSWNGSVWIAGGLSDTNTLAYSYDGKNWVGLGDTIFTSGQSCYGLASRTVLPYVGSSPVAAAIKNATDNFMVATGYGPNTLAYSYDGIHWNGLGSNPFPNGPGICAAWNGSTWLAGGADYTSNYYTIASSSDGIHWTNFGNSDESWSFALECFKIAWNGNMWVAVGDESATLQYSYDGVNWNQANLMGLLGTAVAWNGTLWVACFASSGGPTMCASFDGIEWFPTIGSEFFPSAAFCVAWNGTMFVAGGEASMAPYELTIIYSYDGIHWTPANVNPPSSLTLSDNCYSVAWNGTMWVAVGSDSITGINITYSYDGINWTQANAAIFEESCNSVAWNGSVWVATGTDPNNTIAYSIDGINWTGLGTSIFAGGSGSPLSSGGYGLVSRTVLPYMGTDPIPFLRGNSVSIGGGAGGLSPLSNSIAIGTYAGFYSNNGIAIGLYAGASNINSNSYQIAIGSFAGFSNQGNDSVAIGNGAGSNNQGDDAVAIGTAAGINQSGYAIAIGDYAGYTQGVNAIAIGSEAAGNTQNSNSIAIGNSAAGSSQDIESVAIGDYAGATQSSFAVAIGYYAGYSHQHQAAIAIGSNTGTSNQGQAAIAIGGNAGYIVQGSNTVAIGVQAGYSNQGTNSVAIGYIAGGSNQGTNAIAIGNSAGANNQSNNTIVLDATGGMVNTTTSNSFYVAPIRYDPTTSNTVLYYNSTTMEVVYNTTGNTGYRNTIYSLSSDTPIDTTFNPTNNSVTKTNGDTVSNTITSLQAYASASLSFTIQSVTYSGQVILLYSGPYANYGFLINDGAVFTQVNGGAQFTLGTWKLNTIYSCVLMPDNVYWYVNGALIVSLGSAPQSQLYNLYITQYSLGDSYANIVFGGTNSTLPLSSIIFNSGLETEGFYYNTLIESIAIGNNTGTSNQGSNAIAIGFNAGQSNQQATAIAIGQYAGQNGQQYQAIAIGTYAGYTQAANGIALGYAAGYVQGSNSIAIGNEAGYENQNSNSIAIGNSAGTVIQDIESVAIGDNAGSQQSSFAVAIGYYSGYGYQNQGAIAIGSNAGYSNQGHFAVAIGAGAGVNNQSSATIVLNATGIELDTVQASSFYVSPIRYDPSISTTVLQYNINTNEVVWTIADNTPVTENFMIALGSAPNYIGYSYDGINWTGTKTQVFLNGSGVTAAWNGTTWLAGGYDSNATYDTLANSSDGIHWTSLSGESPFDTVCSCLAWNGNMWVAGGYANVNTNTVAYSYDGVHWTGLGTSVLDGSCNCLAWNGTMWLAGGSTSVGSPIVYSYDGTTWYSTNFYILGLNSVTIRTLVWNGYIWVAAGRDDDFNIGITFYSYDGLNWGQSTCPFNYDVNSAAWNGSIWVLAGLDGDAPPYAVAAYSYDGINWTRSALYTDYVFSVTWNGSLWIAATGVGAETLAYSYDGIVWNSLGDKLFPAGYSISAVVSRHILPYVGSSPIPFTRMSTIAYGTGAGGMVQGIDAVAVGYHAGLSTQGAYSVAIGNTAGQISQMSNSVAIGNTAGNSNQHNDSVAIGSYAGSDTQGIYSIAMGVLAGLSTQQSNAIAIGVNAGQITQGARGIGIGDRAGFSNQQYAAIGIGKSAGRETQGSMAIAMGWHSGRNTQGSNAISIGSYAGETSQGTGSIAIGSNAGTNYQSTFGVAIGYYAGNSNQGNSAIAIGSNAGTNNQGQYTVAIGAGAGVNSQSNNTIVLNASGGALNTTYNNSFYVAPIRSDSNQGNSLSYNTGTGEIIYDTSKTFVINHPKDESKYLVHACLEGPEAGVYYRGTGTIAELETSVEVELPDYVDALAVDLTVQVTPIYNGTVRILNASCVSNNKFTVYGDSGDFHWHVYGRRATVVVEPKKSEVTLHGDGPYRWIS